MRKGKYSQVITNDNETFEAIWEYEPDTWEEPGGWELVRVLGESETLSEVDIERLAEKQFNFCQMEKY